MMEMRMQRVQVVGDATREPDDFTLGSSGEKWTAVEDAALTSIPWPRVQEVALTYIWESGAVRSGTAATEARYGIAGMRAAGPVGRLFEGVSETEPKIEPSDREIVRRELAEVLAGGMQERFEDGMESEFSERLLDLFRRRPADTILLLAELLAREGVEPEVMGEALRWLGAVEHEGTRPLRRWLSERALASTSARIRDGAVVALGSLMDRSAIPRLREAMERETIDALGHDMRELLEVLGGSA